MCSEVQTKDLLDLDTLERPHLLRPVCVAPDGTASLASGAF